MSTAPRCIAVTGATGFVGRALCRRLLRDGWHVVALVRGPHSAAAANLPAAVESRAVGDLTAVEDFAPHLAGVQAVAHLAARVHVMSPTAADEAAFQAMNVVATRRLAEAAARVGVARFLFLSTVKVNGEGGSHRYTAEDAPRPMDAYGRSKAEAEAALAEVAAATGLAVTVIRPPMVYGPGVKANVAALARLCDSGLPLPFGATRNARSMIALDNLVDAIALAMTRPEAAGQTYLVRDGEDLSTGDLIRRIRRAQGRAVRLVPVPQGLMAGALGLLGRAGLADRLFGSLTVDDTAIRRDLGWTPPLTVDDGLRKMLAAPAGARRRLLFLVTEDWYFWSHRAGLARAARDAGWEVHVATRVNGHGERIRAEGFVLHPLSWKRSSRNPLKELAAIAEIHRLYRRVRPQLAHQVALKAVLYGSIAAWMARTPAVVNAMAGMGSVFSSESRSTFARALRPLVTAAFRFLLDRPDHVLVVQNEDDAALFRDRGLVRAERLRLIPGMGVDTTLFHPCPEPQDGPVIATVVARMLWEKGIGETVEAARILRRRGVPVVVRLVGAPDLENPNSVPPETLEAWRAEGVVEVMGPRSDIPAVWAESHIAVLATSYREGMPRSLLEAAACGRPLVTTDAPGCRELMADGALGLSVPRRDPVALADAIERLARDPDLRRAKGAEARRRMETVYGDGPILAAFLALYDDVVPPQQESPA